MKILKTISIFLTVIMCASTNSEEVLGKAYITKLGESCKLSEEGGCNFTRYCELRFERDSVSIYFFRKISCSNPELNKKYNQNKTTIISKWYSQNDLIYIDVDEDFNQLEVKHDRLIYNDKDEFILVSK